MGNGYSNKFFTLEQVKLLMRDAWYTRPTGIAARSSFTEPYESREYPNWQEMWGGADFDEDWFTADMPAESQHAPAIKSILEGSVSAQAISPSTFGVQDWFDLFMGFSRSSTGIFVGLAELQGAGTPPQPMPPSHHLLAYPWPSEDMSAQNYTGLEVEGSSESPTELDLDGGTTSAIEIGLGSTAAGAGLDLERPRVWHASRLGISILESGGLPIIDTQGYGAEYKIEMLPSTRIVLVPYVRKTIAVLSKPPPVPEVSVTPYRAVNNNLLFGFQATFSEIEQVPVPIEPADVALFEKHTTAQGLPRGAAIKFESDDIPAFFQIYRIEKPPNSYSDFAGSLRASVSTLIPNPEKIVRTTSNTHVETLRPNTKYYYTFRTMDSHNNVSNPTVIYEIELVDDAGAVYPLIRSYEIPFISNKVSSVPMKKFIQIIPRLEQVTADLGVNVDDYEDPSDIPLDQVALGLETLEDSIWDKTFKIRLTSKKTGKKIDFNVTFKKQDERKVTS